jgi:hypothetical protein
METAAPGTTAPEGSVTEPLSSPVFAFWALARGAHKIAPIARNNVVRFNMVTPFHGRHSWTPVCHSKHKTHAEADGFLHRRLLRERLNRMLGAARVDPTKVGLGTLKKINVS